MVSCIHLRKPINIDDMFDRDSHEIYRLLVESYNRVCMGCEKERGLSPDPNGSHGYCRRHALEFVQVMAKHGMAPDIVKQKIAKIEAMPDTDFPPDMAEQNKQGEMNPVLTPPQAQPAVAESVKIIGKDNPPPYLNAAHGDDEGEIDIAAKSGFTAYTHALQTRKHHPKLLKAVTGTVYEPLYKREFKIQ